MLARLAFGVILLWVASPSYALESPSATKVMNDLNASIAALASQVKLLNAQVSKTMLSRKDLIKTSAALAALTLTLQVEANAAGGLLLGSPSPVPTACASDGHASAPVVSGGPQLPTILNGYAARPGWQVAGVDYPVGIPTASLPLKDASVATPPIGVTRHTTPFKYWEVTANNVDIDGWDFSAGGNWSVNVNSGVSGTIIRNSKWALSGVMLQAPIYVDQASSGTIQYNEFDGGGAADDADFLITIFGTGGTWNLQYNWFKNASRTSVKFGSATSGAAGSINFQYNLIQNSGLAGAGHGDWFSNIAGSIYTNIVQDYNTGYQTTMGGPSGNTSTIGFNQQNNPDDTTYNNGSVQCNTFVLIAGDKVSVSPLVSLDSTELIGTITVGHNYFDPTGLQLNTGTYASPVWNDGFLVVDHATGHGHSGTIDIQTNNVNMLTGAVVANYQHPHSP